MLFLSRAEWNYLTANSEISEDYSRVIKSRLQKKLSVFVNQELPILIEKRYLDVTKFRNVTEKCNTLVAERTIEPINHIIIIGRCVRSRFIYACLLTQPRACGGCRARPNRLKAWRRGT